MFFLVVFGMVKKCIVVYGYLFWERVCFLIMRVGYVFLYWNKSEYEYVCGKFLLNVEGGLFGV